MVLRIIITLETKSNQTGEAFCTAVLANPFVSFMMPASYCRNSTVQAEAVRCEGEIRLYNAAQANAFPRDMEATHESDRKL